MKILYTGGSKSGKSLLALEKAQELAGSGRLYYLATMQPHDAEDEARIARHKKEREGRDFETLECPLGLADVLAKTGGRGVFLLDSLTALLSNRMFTRAGLCRSAAAELLPELLAFAGSAESFIAVSDSIGADCGGYGGLTEEFRAGLAVLERGLAASFDSVQEVSAFQALELKTENSEREVRGVHLITGGAHQGKTAFALERLGITDGDICVCGEPDKTKRCLSHLERLAEGGFEGARASLDEWLDAQPQGLIICDDIFCGVVPADADIRASREAAGQLLCYAAQRAAGVTRIICGLPQRLK